MRTFRRGLAAAALGLALVAGATACSSSDAVTMATPAEANAALKAGATAIDVRTPPEYAAGHIPGAVNINVESPSFGDEIAQLDPKATYIVYCRSGRRSALAADQMAKAGFTDVRDLGGLQGWADAGYPVET